MVKGSKMSLESRKRISESLKGDKNHFYGKKHSPETKARMSAKIVSQETRDKIAASRKGKLLSPEHKAKIKAGVRRNLDSGWTMSVEARKKISDSKIGSKHYRWSGDRRKTKTGYIEVRLPDHPNVGSMGFVSEHRVVMEKHLGRYLSRDEKVHHINGVRDDNRIENLKLMTNAEHSRLHRLQEMERGQPLWCNIKRNNKGQISGRI